MESASTLFSAWKAGDREFVAMAIVTMPRDRAMDIAMRMSAQIAREREYNDDIDFIDAINRAETNIIDVDLTDIPEPAGV